MFYFLIGHVGWERVLNLAIVQNICTVSLEGELWIPHDQIHLAMMGGDVVFSK